jgi:WD40 repeat protein
LALSPDAKTVIGVGEVSNIFWWDVQKAARTAEYWSEKVDVKGHAAAFAPDGKSLVIGGDSQINFLDVNTRKAQRKFISHAGEVTAVTFSRDTKFLASSGRDNTILLWNVSDGRLLRTLIGHNGWITSLSLSPDNSQLASSSADGTTRLWRLR